MAAIESMIPVAIMAGGRGARLHPLTEELPKPLFGVGGKPILAQIVEGFASQGFTKFYFCVNYRAELIEKHFGSGARYDVKIRYIHEPEPLGTAGALRSLSGKVSGPVIVCNADVLSKVSYGDLLETHAKANADATVCLALHQHQIPYGVATFDGERFTGLREKPIENILVNAGIYVLDSSVLEAMPEGYCDMPDLIARCSTLAYYPIENAWFDLGSFVDLARANNVWLAA